MPCVDFFIIGAPKCGTTSLAEYLKMHPHINFSKQKEPTFFSSDYPGLRTLSEIKSEKDYLELFRFEKGRLTGEGSTKYLFSDNAIKNIIRHNPTAKFIVMLRNPSDMVVAWHSQNLKAGNENEPDFEKAWSYTIERKQGRNLPPLCTDAKLLFYKDVCLLGKQIQKLFQHVTRNNVHIIFLEDLKADPVIVYKQVLNFLELSYDGRVKFDTFNQYRQYRSYKFDNFRLKLNRFRVGNERVNRFYKMIVSMFPFFNNGLGVQNFLLLLNYKKGERQKIRESFRQKLVEEFLEDICLLEKLTGRNLEHWKK